ncbi:PaaI family thioesterase [Balneolaceae bacterium ANBcel3]|nr:PaaI family thioesterase [Balneolaceae bacterium ANBcel3]
MKRLSTEVSRIKGSHERCIACGSLNEHGLHLSFQKEDDGSISAVFDGDKRYEGYPGRLHGGIISMVLDSAMTNCLFHHGHVAVTAELNVRFLKPVLTQKEMKITARINKCAHALFWVEAKIVQEGVVKATAKARFFEQMKKIR